MSSLSGKRILITRPRSQAAELVEKLIGLGAIPVLFPTIEIAPAEDPSALDQAIEQLDTYDWILFTSVNGVDSFFTRMKELGKGSAAMRKMRVAAIGPATAQSLEEKGVVASYIPEEYIAESIPPGLGDIFGRRILLPRADIARKALVDELKKLGAIPNEVVAYQTRLAQPRPEELAELEKGIDVATFTSSSTVRNFLKLVGDRAGDLLKGAVIACIGPITAETARACGLTVDLVAGEYTVDGLVQALVEYESFKKNKELL
jgi:uroporphyrinogen-III synthase